MVSLNGDRRARSATMPAMPLVAVRLITLGLIVAPLLAPAATAQPAEHRLPSRPETVVWGEIPVDRAPVLTIRSGDTVAVDTLSHSGATQDEDPVAFLGARGVARDEVLQDAIDFWKSRPGRPRDGRAGHILTGPIYIEGAAPGDTLEIQVLDLTLRTPFGMNGSATPSGVLADGYPGTRPTDARPVGAPRVIRTRTENGRGVADLTPDLVVPLRPFMGIMAVAPAPPRIGQPGITVEGVQSTRPPGPFGGNLDYKDLGTGSTLFLPVFHPGARFYVGDPHSVQGDGEVNGTAIEHSLAGRFRFVLHKGKTLTGPRAETATHYVMMGIDLDLDRAMRLATAEVIDFLTREKGLSPADAYTLASIACDFHIAEAVDLTQVVVGKIPKNVFRRR
jgi:acetamidase/formamidase